MVMPVSDPGLIANVAPAARPATARADVENTNSEAISTTLRRVVALTAKFGPDPVTGSPLQIIAGEDVEAAETNDLQRLAQANLGLSSPENAFQGNRSAGAGCTAILGSKYKYVDTKRRRRHSRSQPAWPLSRHSGLDTELCNSKRAAL